MATFLFVDDDKKCCLLYEQELEFEGYDVVTANGWSRALVNYSEKTLYTL